MLESLDIVVTLTSLSITLLSFVYWGKPSSSASLPSPPGPPAIWLLGNLFRIPTEKAWLKFTQWKHEYGPLVYLHGLGKSILILNTEKAISDLLDKRGNLYSHRPRFIVAGELMGLDNSMPLMPYGNIWRMHRKLAHTVLGLDAVKKYHVVQEDLSALMARDFLENPKDFIAHVRLIAGRIIMAVTYGLSVQAADDKYITHAEETMAIIVKATVPATYLVDLFPFLKHVPSWFPLIPFHRDGLLGRQMIDKLIIDPFEHVKAEMKAGTALPSFTHDLLESPEVSSEDELNDFQNTVKWVAGAMYGAGGETTYATVLTFILAMTIYPEAQSKAQKEIDDVIGTDRLPTMQDRPSLPYVNALINETLRWRPALPLGIARQTAKDDMYEGYYIPAGTIVIPNVWALTKENSTYPVADFIPERFLGSERIIDPNSYAFGFGRRICPGKQLGANNVFILISTILASFDIFPPVDEEGRERPADPTFSPGLVSYPGHYECRIVPRSTAKATIIKDKASSVKI